MKATRMAYKARIWIPKALATESRLEALTDAAGGCTVHAVQGRWLESKPVPGADWEVPVNKEAIVLVEVFAMPGAAACATSTAVFDLVMLLAKDGEKAVLYEVDGVPLMYE